MGYRITHDIGIRDQCLDFKKKKLKVIPTSESNKKKSDACRNTYFLGKHHVLSNLLRWHPTVFNNLLRTYVEFST